MRLLRRLWSRIVSVALIEFRCWHLWKIKRIEEETEKCRYRVHVECRKCGRTGSYCE